jgi:dTDP-4-amino-4,6-dideoxygalactose transaminase
MIPYLDLVAQHRAIRADLDAAMARVFDTCRFIQGPPVVEFETEFSRLFGYAHTIGVNSGTSALHLALLALGIGRGDEVVTTTHTFIATAAAVCYTGARPVLVDIDPDRMTMNPAMLAGAVTPRTKAIIPVHMHGQSADMGAILSVADHHGLAVIEDASQAHGAAHLGRSVGGIGRIGCFSFYPGKNLGGCGEGGCIVTNDFDLAGRMRALRDWGQTKPGVHELLGFNNRMDSIQAALLSVKLQHLAAWTAARRRVAAMYDRGFAAAGLAQIAPRRCPDGQHVYHHYVIRVQDRDSIRGRLAARGVQTSIHYPLPVHLQPAMRFLGYRDGDFPVAESLARSAISLPIYPELTDDLVAEIVAAVAAAISDQG